MDGKKDELSMSEFTISSSRQMQIRQYLPAVYLPAIPSSNTASGNAIIAMLAMIAITRIL